ncbi:lactose permease [Penicillium malachiteum]|uniref:lactose permease n=1 Tax=Penicillium malachiteum TaxID=1324776 RepID=UPI0025467984|nr:lactose permease [Penicillium malachiteum]KAJ5737227.1 lactose permease [Penicillium malachiteum]
MFTSGRFVLGFGVCFANVNSPVYVGESGPPRLVWSIIRYIGSIVAAWEIYGTQTQANGWRTLLYCQFIANDDIALAI